MRDVTGLAKADRQTGVLLTALVEIAAVIASFVTMYAVGARLSAGESAGIMSAVLSLSLARRQRDSSISPWVMLAALPLVAVASALVGVLLESVPVLGAAFFVAAICLSVWLRQFGPAAVGVGRLIALPFIVMLIVPARLNAPGGPLVDFALVVGSGLAAFGWTALLSNFSMRIGLTHARPTANLPPPQPRRSTAGDLSVSTRMALQMGVALALAFALGFAFFGAHWGWVVITAFIVCSGARGRGDAIYKGLLRLGGAVAGTVVAAGAQFVAVTNGMVIACTIFAVLFVGMWKRERNYAYWAGCITLVLALLQRSGSGDEIALLIVRLGGIVVGALCAIVATFFVYPIRTESIVRRRIADVLVALDDVLHGGHMTAAERTEKLAVLDLRIAELDRVAAPVELHRRVFAREVDEHPAVWIGITREFGARARERAGASSADGGESTQMAIRHSRRSIGKRLTPEETAQAEGASVTASLRRLRDLLAETADPDAE